MNSKISLLLKKSAVLFITWIAAVFTIMHADAAVTPVQQEPVLVDGISQKLVPNSSPNPTFARILYFGAYHEFIFGPTHSQYQASPVGVLVGFQHTLNSFLRGGLELRWSHWQAKDISNYPRYIMPVGLYSKITIQPAIPLYTNGSLSPYLTAGLGYMVPFQGDKFFTMNVPKYFGMVMFIGGGGIEWRMNQSIALSTGFDTWVDLEGNDFFAGDLSFSFVIRF